MSTVATSPDFDEFRQGFDNEQWEAVVAPGDVLVSAAAGSGKTRVLVGRMLHAILFQGYELTNIIAVTFTEKAADEMRHRLGEQLGAAGRHDQVAQLEHARIGTIHSLCRGLLRQWGMLVGIDPGFVILDETQAEYLRHRALSAAIDQLQHADDAAARLCARYGDSDVRAYVLAAHRFAARTARGEPRFVLPGEAIEAGCHEDAQLLGHLYTAFRERYERLKIRAGGLDFDDLQRFALQLLSEDDVVTQLRNDVQRVLVDEFQDTDELQSAILARIAGGELFTVGDEWQSIYRFRGADVGVFRRRADKLDPLPVSGNYRSLPAVLGVVNYVFGHSFGDSFRPINARRPAETGEAPACQITLVKKQGGDFRIAEAALVADSISELAQNGVDPSEIAILVPRRKHGRTFERAVRNVGVPVACQASGGFFDAWEVRDALAMLAWSANRFDDAAALTVLASPLFGLSWEALLEIRDGSATVYDGLRARAEGGSEIAAAALKLREDIATIGANAGLVDAVDHAVRGSGYEVCVALAPAGRTRVANLRKLIDLAADAGSVEATSVAAFTELVEAQRHLASREGEAVVADEASGAVRIMTVHQSKGLEFDHVFVVDLGGKGSNQHPKAFFVRDEHDLLAGTTSVQAMSVDGTEAIVGERLEELRRTERAEGDDEQQRLLYVAMTRAKVGLHLVGSYGVNPKGPSRLEGHLLRLCNAFGVDPVDSPLVVSFPELSCEIEIVAEPPGAEIVLDRAPPPIFELASPRWTAAGDGELLTTPLRGEHPLGRGESTTIDAVSAERGSQMHEALALRMADPTYSIAHLVDGNDVQLVDAIVATPIFAEHHAAGGRAELSFQCMRDGTLVNGRFDVCAVDGTAWRILDYKSSLPATADEAWARHGEQLEGYAHAARAGGAEQVILTLLSIGDPTVSYSWSR